MNRSIIATLGFLILPLQLAAQPNHPVGIQRPAVVERWLETLENNNTALEAEQWKKAKRTANALLDEMCDRIESGTGAESLLGTAAFQRSIAEAGLGNEADAKWDYQAAQTLMPQLAEVDLSRYGAVGSLLEPARTPAGSGPPEIDVPVDTNDVTPPRRTRGPQPKYPFASFTACIEGPIMIQAVINTEGRLTGPRLLTPQEPVLGFAAIDALKHWRFKPARNKGEPIETIYNLTVDFGLKRCTNLFATAKKGRDGR